MKKIILIMAGNISLSLGVAGLFLPLLPTTPFLLLAATCYLQSSDRLYKWITRHRLFGTYISGYLKFHAIPRKARIISLILLWAVITGTIVFFVHVLWLRILLFFIAAGVSIHLCTLRTLTEEMIKAIHQSDAADIGITRTNGK